MNSTLKLSTKLSLNGKTQLDEYFVTPPFKVMTLSAYADSWRNGLSAMQMSSSPGLLAGDRVDIQITLEKSTALFTHGMRGNCLLRLSAYFSRYSSLCNKP